MTSSSLHAKALPLSPQWSGRVNLLICRWNNRPLLTRLVRWIGNYSEFFSPTPPHTWWKLFSSLRLFLPSLTWLVSFVWYPSFQTVYHKKLKMLPQIPNMSIEISDFISHMVFFFTIIVLSFPSSNALHKVCTSSYLHFNRKNLFILYNFQPWSRLLKCPLYRELTNIVLCSNTSTLKYWSKSST